MGLVRALTMPAGGVCSPAAAESGRRVGTVRSAGTSSASSSSPSGEEGGDGPCEDRSRQGQSEQVGQTRARSRLLQDPLLRGGLGNRGVVEWESGGVSERPAGIAEGGFEPRRVREDPRPLQEEALGGERKAEIGWDRLLHLLVADLARGPAERGERDAADLLRDQGLESPAPRTAPVSTRAWPSRRPGPCEAWRAFSNCSRLIRPVRTRYSPSLSSSTVEAAKTNRPRRR